MSTPEGPGLGPESELPEHLRQALASSLEAAPLTAPSPLQARYSSPLAGAPRGLRLHGGMMAFSAGVAAMLVVIGLMGIPQPRSWIVRTVNSAVRQVSAPAASPTPSKPASETGGESPKPRTSPSEEGRESPEPSRSESPEPRSTPDEHETSAPPAPADGSGGGGDRGDGATPSPEPSDGSREGSPTPGPTPSGDGH